MFISGLGFFSCRQSGSLTKHQSPFPRKCQFNGQETLRSKENKEQLYKNMVVWRRDWCVFGAVGGGGWGVML